MTNDLAIRILTGDVLGTTEQTQEAVKIAVEALSKPDVTDINVGDTISRQAAIDAVKDRYFKYYRFAKLEELVWAIEKLPSAQPERKMGQWVERWHNNKHVLGDMACSVCGAQMLLTFPRFCPNCGADMRGKQNE